MKKFKEWLWKSDDDGVTNLDAICMFFWNLMAWFILIIGGLLTR